MKGDEPGGESLFLEAVLVTNFVVEFGKPLESSLEMDDFHGERLGVMEWWNSGVTRLPTLHDSSTPLLL
jgi:hypothetical protein